MWIELSLLLFIVYFCTGFLFLLRLEQMRRQDRYWKSKMIRMRVSDLVLLSTVWPIVIIITIWERFKSRGK